MNTSDCKIIRQFVQGIRYEKILTVANPTSLKYGYHHDTKAIQPCSSKLIAIKKPQSGKIQKSRCEQFSECLLFLLIFMLNYV